MAEKNALVVDIPEVYIPAVHQEYETKPIVDFFDDEDRQRRYTTGRKLAAKKELVIPAAEAERDSKWAQANGIPEGIDFVLFVGDDGIIRYVFRAGGRLCRDADGLDSDWNDDVWVTCPRK